MTEVPALLIRIAERYRPGMTSLELYEATRGVWRAGSRRETLSYAICVATGHVVEVYEVAGWFPAGTTAYFTRTNADVRIPGRWEFVGRVAEPRVRSALVGADVHDLLRPGAQNPITYVGLVLETGQLATTGRSDVNVELGQPPEDVNGWLYERLIEAARAGAILTYSDVGGPLGLNFESPADRNVVARLLGEISRFEVAQGRPMLSSVVWHKDLSSPGVGLRNLGIELGLVRGDEDDLAFGTRQVKATHQFWRGR